MTTWLLIFAMGIVSYATRALPLLAPWRHAHPTVERTLRHLPPAVIAALMLASLVSPGVAVAPASSTLAGLLVGSTIAWQTRSVPLTIVAGVGAFFLAESVIRI
jgi:branched-subunit amino acid transport protein